MKKILTTFCWLLLLAGTAQAQAVGQLPSGTVWGNASASQAIARATTITALLDRVFCSTENAALVRNSTAWVCLTSANNGVWVTSASGVPSISSTLPQAVQDNITRLGTIVSGVWNGTPLVTAYIGDDQVTNAKLRESAGLSVIGRTANSTGNPADIVAANDHQVLRRSGTAIGFGAVNLSSGNAVTGSLPIGNIAAIADDTVLGNVTGSSAAPAAITFTQWMDAVCGNTQGMLAYRGASSWACLAVGTSSQALIGGTAPSWGSVPVGGIASIGDGTILSNISGGSAAPAANTLTALLDDAFSSTQGAVLYRSGSAWVALAPGTSGQVLSSGGGGADVSWETIAGTGTVTQVDAGTGMAFTSITSTGSVSIDKATDSNIWAATADKTLTADTVFNAAGALVVLSGTSTVTPDFSTGFNFTFTATSATNYTLANPTNAKVGQQGCIYLVQPASGSVVTIGYGSNWKTAGGTSGKTLTATLGAVDRICYLVRTTSFIDFTLAKDIK